MVIGIIGGGQLAKMLVLAGYPMGQEFIILDPASEAAAGRVARQLIGDYDDQQKLHELSSLCDVITYDFENVPATTIDYLQQQRPCYPPAAALAAAQDRLAEKNLFNRLGIRTASYWSIASLDELQHALQCTTLPAILKTRRFGYDGKGQFIIRSHEQAATAWTAINEQAAILEAFVTFDFEVSLLSVRSQTGEIAFYPLVRNTHRNGILHLSIAPYSDPALQQQAEDLASPLLTELNYVGVLAVEFFVKDNRLIANEMAPRVHNSGHWTIEGAVISQFENHLRAILALPLGTTQVQGYAAMLNFISQLPRAEDILKIPACHFHNYGKAARPGRKLGHATLRAASPEELQLKINAIESLIPEQN